MSATTRKHIAELAAAIKQRMALRPFGTAFPTRKLLQDIRATSDRVCCTKIIATSMRCFVQAVTREIYDDALNELCKNEVIARTGGDKVRLLKPLAAAPTTGDNDENRAPPVDAF